MQYTARMSASRPSPLASPEPWNLVASGYVVENILSFETFAREALRLVPAQGDVLDVAAGPGSLALQAAATARSVQAIDFAPQMLDQLRARAAAANITNVEARVADGQALPFPADRFDAAYSMFGLIFFPDPGLGLRELVRVLRPGGRAVVASWPPFEKLPTLAAMFAAMKAEMPNSGIGDAPTVLGTPDDIRAVFSAAGFSSVDVQEHSIVAGMAPPEALWGSFSRGGAPAVLMRKRMGEPAFADLSKRIVARLEQTLGTEPVAVRLTALFGIGTR